MQEQESLLPHSSFSPNSAGGIIPFPQGQFQFNNLLSDYETLGAVLVACAHHYQSNVKYLLSPKDRERTKEGITHLML